MPPDLLRVAVLSGPAMVTMSTSCIVKDDLHGYCDHFSGAGDPQWPWTGGLGPGAYHTGHHRPHLVSKLMTAFGWGGKLMTASDNHLWAERLMDDCLLAERVRCHWVVNILNTNFI